MSSTESKQYARCDSCSCVLAEPGICTECTIRADERERIIGIINEAEEHDFLNRDGHLWVRADELREAIYGN